MSHHSVMRHDQDAITDDRLQQHILYQLLVDWYGSIHLNKPLSSSDLTHQWTTLWFAKREQQKLADQQLYKYRQAIDELTDYQPLNLKEKVAMIILYDQLTRNIFRGTGDAYKYDGIARGIALSIVETVPLSTLHIQYLLTTLICLIHSENLEHLNLVKSSIEQHVVGHPSIDSNLLGSLNGIVQNHYDRIHLFGRIPERNRFIDRSSTASEIAFMNAVNTKELL